MLVLLVESLVWAQLVPPVCAAFNLSTIFSLNTIVVSAVGMSLFVFYGSLSHACTCVFRLADVVSNMFWSSFVLLLRSLKRSRSPRARVSSSPSLRRRRRRSRRRRTTKLLWFTPLKACTTRGTARDCNGVGHFLAAFTPRLAYGPAPCTARSDSSGSAAANAGGGCAGQFKFQATTLRFWFLFV